LFGVTCNWCALYVFMNYEIGKRKRKISFHTINTVIIIYQYLRRPFYNFLICAFVFSWKQAWGSLQISFKKRLRLWQCNSSPQFMRWHKKINSLSFMKVASLTIFRVSAVARNSWQDCILRVWRKERKCGCEGRTAFWRVSRGWTNNTIGWILIRGQWIWERLRFWGWWVEDEILSWWRI
jgi:hypothetical protein